MPNDESSSKPANKEDTLEARLAKGLQLAEALTTPTTAGTGTATATEEEGKTKKTDDKTATEAAIAPAPDEDGEPAPLPEERNGILFLFEGDLQYELPPARKRLVDVGGTDGGGAHAAAFPHRCQWPGCGAVEAAEEREVVVAAEGEQGEGEEEEGGGAAASRSSSSASTVVVVTQKPRFPACAKCHQARYCGREHQVEDWKGKGGHKASCAQFAFLRACAEGKERLDRRDVVVKLLFKIRLHLGPYLVAHGDKQGRGFGFVQSASTLEELFLMRPVGPRGQPLERSVVVHYLTMGEFVSVVLEDDFELTFAKDPLEQALATYDPTTHYVVVLKLRCGYVAVLRVPLVGVGLCRALAADYQYAEHPELQLNID